jgi:hypothetical protein
MDVNGEFLDALIRSPTFWQETAGPAAVSLSLIMLVVFLGRRYTKKNKRRRLLPDISGAAAAVDFILTIPIVFAVTFLIVQFALLSHASLVVHYAAYASARSARVWYWDYDTAFIDGVLASAGIPLEAIQNNFAGRLLANNGDAEVKAKLAAAFALIPIAPAHYPAGAAANTEKSPAVQAVIREIVKLTEDQTAVPGTRTPVVRRNVVGRKASYAFSPNNTEVLINPVNPQVPDSFIDVADEATTFAELFSSGIAWQVQADVEFRYLMNIPFAARLFGDRQPEGFYARHLSAQVRLL